MNTSLEDLWTTLKWKNFNSETSVHDLLRKIKSDISFYLKKQTPEKKKEITTSLDSIKARLDWLTRLQIERLLYDIYKTDSEIWGNHQWEDFNFNDPRQHESNTQESFQKTGIEPIELLRIAERSKKPTERLPILILRMAYIYWLTPTILIGKP